MGDRAVHIMKHPSKTDKHVTQTGESTLESFAPTPPGNFNTGPHGLVFEPMDQNRTKVDQNMSRVQSKSFEFYKFY